jgi:uncharacterized membrane protein
MIYPAAYVAALLVFFLADMVWLGTMVSRLYRPALGDLLLAGVNMLPAILFYLLYPIGLVIFAIVPALKSGNITTALFLGALFGFFTYGTYDLTNQATLRNWSTTLTIADMAWGSVLGGISAMCATWAVTKLFQQT